MLDKVIRVLLAGSLVAPSLACAVGTRLSVDATPSGASAAQVGPSRHCQRDEVELHLAYGSPLRGKILEVDDELVTVTVHPYWPPATTRLPVEGISVVKVLRSRRNAGTLGAACAGITFAACGLLAVGSSECKSDADAGIAMAAGAGLVAGALGAAVGLATEGRVKRTYVMKTLSPEKRSEILRSLALACPLGTK